MEGNRKSALQFKRNSNQCAQCSRTLIAPVWTEYLKEHCIRHLWNCDACGYEYETLVYLVPRDTAEHAVDAAA